MDNNQKRFIEDSLDLLNELDEGLMQLESNPNATAPLEQVFRTMHTVKGGANMFGFENIGNLAHQLETLYDLVRQGKLQISDALISITLQAFDKVRDLLKEKDITKITNSEELNSHIKIAVNFLKEIEISSHADGFIESGGQKEELVTFFIRITPTVSITPDGNHPLIFIIQDLEAVGTSKSFLYTHDDKTIKHWDIYLATTTVKSELESYFLFVEDECKTDFQRLLAINLLEHAEFMNHIERFTTHAIEKTELIAFVGQLEDLVTEIKSDEEDAGLNVIKKKIQNDSYIKVSKRKVDDLLNWISELIIIQAQLTTHANQLQSAALVEVNEQLEMITSRLRDTSLEIGLVPIETLVTKFKRLVRDLSKTLEKKVNFLSEGADTEMDKDVIEVMAEPIMHIIRNCIDHGIEKPFERKANGKSEHGTVKLKAFNSSSYINIVISDDGKGIDKERVLQKAIEKGLTTSDAILTEEEVLMFIFHSGLSTAEKVSDVSGRGVGMDVVKQKINDLRGNITITSKLGKGTAIHIKLPMSRSIIEGLLVRVDKTRYVVPLNVIERIDRLDYVQLDREFNVNKTVLINDEPLFVFSIRNHFHNNSTAPKSADVISVSVNGLRKGIAVDRIEGKMQTVLKPLGDVYQHQDFIAGSTILGDGSLALVLDPQRLFNLSIN